MPRTLFRFVAKKNRWAFANVQYRKDKKSLEIHMHSKWNKRRKQTLSYAIKFQLPLLLQHTRRFVSKYQYYSEVITLDMVIYLHS